jgi:hypothetical protein
MRRVSSSRRWVCVPACRVRWSFRLHPRSCIRTRPQEGVGALFKGWTPSVLGVIPYVGLNFAVYETLKAMMIQHYGETEAVHLGAGVNVLLTDSLYCAYSLDSQQPSHAFTVLPRSRPGWPQVCVTSATSAWLLGSPAARLLAPLGRQWPTRLTLQGGDCR